MRRTIRKFSVAKNIYLLLHYKIAGIVIESEEIGRRIICSCGRVSNDEGACSDCGTPINTFMPIKLSLSHYRFSNKTNLAVRDLDITHDALASTANISMLTISMEASDESFNIEEITQTIFEVEEHSLTLPPTIPVGRIIAVENGEEVLSVLDKSHINPSEILKKELPNIKNHKIKEALEFALNRNFNFDNTCSAYSSIASRKYNKLDKSNPLTVELMKFATSYMVERNNILDGPIEFSSCEEILEFIGVVPPISNYLNTASDLLLVFRSNPIKDGKIFPQQEFLSLPICVQEALITALRYKKINILLVIEIITELCKVDLNFDILAPEGVTYELFVKYFFRTINCNDCISQQYSYLHIVDEFFKKIDILLSRKLPVEGVINQKTLNAVALNSLLTSRGYPQTRIDAIFTMADVDMKAVFELMGSKAQVKPEELYKMLER